MLGLIITAVVLSALSGGAMFVAFRKLKVKASGGAAKIDVAGLVREVQVASDELVKLATYKDSFWSQPQFDTLKKHDEELKGQLEAEKAKLKEIEGRLESAQKNVEEKETAQQLVKSAKAEDEAKLAEIMSKYEDVSGEAIALEQKLAASLKNLDSLMNELELTQDQKNAIKQLNDAVSAAGERMRELMTEYQMIKERLDGLVQQHNDLEEEYTRLVEQQLGE